MGLRFRRSVRLFPGVRLNFSGSGISTTIGVRGMGVTLGAKGTYANVGLPGTGLSYRTRISPAPGKAQPDWEGSVTPSSIPQPDPPFHSTAQTAGVEQIHSGSVSTMTSPGLGELKRLINEAALRRTVLTRAVSSSEELVRSKERKLAFAQRFIIRLFTQKAVPRLTSELAQARSVLGDEQAELEGCYISIDFGLDDASTGTFAALCRSFSVLSASQKIWDITESAATDRAKERTTATSRVNRSPVTFDLGQVDLIQSDYSSLRLQNASSLEIHLFPGFVLTKETGSDFALVEWKDLRVEFSPIRFIEADPVPGDSEVIGHTWAKANKDGSPDRRFADNYQIPIARYGELWLRSSTGLYEAYMVSNCASAEDFGAAVSNHRNALSLMDQAPKAVEPEPEQLDEMPEAAIEDKLPESPSRFSLDWIALGILVFLLGVGGNWLWSNSPKLLAAMRPAEPTIASVPPPVLLPSAYVVPAALNVRAEPSTKARIVQKLGKGTRVTIFQVQGNWSQIGETSPAGWALTTLLSETVSQPPRTIDAR